MAYKIILTDEHLFSPFGTRKHVKDTPITAVAKGQGTWTDRFGGEGTGLKSMNFELGEHKCMLIGLCITDKFG